MFKAVHNYFNQSITRLVMASFVFVLLFPLGFLAISLPEESWGSVRQEVREKHLLIAKSIEESINLYFLDFQKSAQIFANTINITDIEDQETIQSYLDGFVRNSGNVVVGSYLSLDDYSKVISVRDAYKPPVQNKNKVIEEPYLKYLSFGNRHHTISTISPVFRSTISKRPVVLVKTYIYDKKYNKRGILYAELKLDYLNSICEKINASSKERCIIVDSRGQVVAHPRQKWVDNIYKLSKTKIVQKLRSEQAGAKRFKTAILGKQKEYIDAGYTLIDKLDWGVIIAQPKLAIDSPMDKVMITILKWLVLGIVFALIIAYLLTRQITRPINSLVTKSQEADIRSDTFNLGAIPKNSPAEICKLWTAISSLVARLQQTNKEVKKLNYSLEEDIAKATAKLRATNRYLYSISSKDHLTKIANRRFFEDSVEKKLKNKIGQRASIILIDVDKFKFINDEYGHEAGDMALVHIARLMRQCTRKVDLPARLGGDEFVIYIDNCDSRALAKIAENLRRTVETTPIFWEGTQVNLSLSIGTVNAKIDGKITLTQLLKFADEAMYVSKEQGRNHVSAYSFEKAKLIELNKLKKEKQPKISKLKQLKKQKKSRQKKLRSGS